MLDEKQIVKRLAEGDIMSLEVLYNEYGSQVYSYALSLTKSKELAEDAVTDAFIQTYEYVRKTKEVKSLKALVYTICRNKAFDEMKYRSRIQEMPEDWQIPDGAFPMDEKIAVRSAVNALPSPEKDIVILYCVHELKHKEIAKVLGIPEGTVRWKYRNALKTLKQSLREH